MANQKELKLEAQEILERWNLMGLLERYGDAKLVGSVVLELIVKLDLDIHVLLPHGDLMEVTNKITTELLDTEGIRELRISDYRRSSNGIKIGIDECPAPSGNWTIDIWLTKDWTTTGFDKTERINAELTPIHREIVVRLKQHYYDKGLLRNGISSKIYDAVLSGVKTIDEFEATYL